MASWAATRPRAITFACSVIAGEGDGMQRDDWYSTARSGGPGFPGDRGLCRDVRWPEWRGARSRTCQVPVLFEAPRWRRR